MKPKTGFLEQQDESLASVLPHRKPMLLLDGIRKVEKESCHAWMKVDPQAWYAQEDGALPGCFGIELMAQTIAAYSGSTTPQKDGKPRIGFLLGTHNYNSHVAAFPGGTVLDVHVHSYFKDPSGLFAFQCQICNGTDVLAESMLKVFQQP